MDTISKVIKSNKTGPRLHTALQKKKCKYIFLCLDIHISCLWCTMVLLEWLFLIWSLNESIQPLQLCIHTRGSWRVEHMVESIHSCGFLWLMSYKLDCGVTADWNCRIFHPKSEQCQTRCKTQVTSYESWDAEPGQTIRVDLFSPTLNIGGFALGYSYFLKWKRWVFTPVRRCCVTAEVEEIEPFRDFPIFLSVQEWQISSLTDWNHLVSRCLYSPWSLLCIFSHLWRNRSVHLGDSWGKYTASGLKQWSVASTET